MASFFGWVIVGVAAWLIYSAFRRPDPAAAAAGAEPARGGTNRAALWGGIVALVLGLGMAFSPALANARLSPQKTSRKDLWVINPAAGPEAPIRWEGNTLVADLESGSGRYAVLPVDWNATRFQAEWDMTFSRLDLPGEELTLMAGGKPQPYKRSRLDFASVCVGLMDPSAANIDDRDHVSGSAIQACFSDDIRLRASDANFIVRTASAEESGKEKYDRNFRKGEPFRIELGKKYHCALAYEDSANAATLTVSDETRRPLVQRRLEDLKDFTNSLAWFGVSIRGYNRFDKKLDATKKDTGYTRPRAVVQIENIQYLQP